MCSLEEAKERMAEREVEREKDGDGEGEGEGEGEGGEKEREREGESEEPMDQGNSDSVPSNQNAEDESKDNVSLCTHTHTPVQFISLIPQNNQTTQQETTADEGDPKPVKPDARTSSDSSEQEEAVTEVEKEKNGVFQMFQLVVVNSYGSQDIKKLPNDDSVLRLTSERQKFLV